METRRITLEQLADAMTGMYRLDHFWHTLPPVTSTVELEAKRFELYGADKCAKAIRTGSGGYNTGTRVATASLDALADQTCGQHD